MREPENHCAAERETAERGSSALPAAGGPPRTKRVLLHFPARDAESAAMMRGIAHFLQTRGGWTVHLDEGRRTGPELRWQLAHGWCGVISRDTSPALIEGCAAFQLPLVALDDAPPPAGVSKILNDNDGIGAMGGEFFLDRGFRHFAFVGDAASGWACEREQGFVEAVRLGGHHAAVFRDEAAAAGGLGGGAPSAGALAAWLRQLPKPAGVMACDDWRAMQILAAAHVAALQIPEELSVLGAGNDEVRCELAVPTLSSVAPGAFQAGYQAAEHLAQRLAGAVGGICDLRIEPVQVVGRRSTDALAIPDRAVATAVRYIGEHACRGLTVGEVLPQAAVSRAQLEKKFRQYLGRSPQAEIRRVQVARIRQLLTETDLPLKRIAELTGFDYMEYLCVVFRRLTGETPGAFRRRQQPAGRAAPNQRGASAG